MDNIPEAVEVVEQPIDPSRAGTPKSYSDKKLYAANLPFYVVHTNLWHVKQNEAIEPAPKVNSDILEVLVVMEDVIEAVVGEPIDSTDQQLNLMLWISHF